MSKPRKCVGCGDQATQRVEDFGPVCPLCAQAPEAVKELVIADVLAATKACEAFTAKLHSINERVVAYQWSLVAEEFGP